jgi:ATP-dependent DNA helicase RecQ
VHHKISEEKKDSRTVTTRVILALEKSQMSSRQLVEDLPFEKNDVFKTLQSLLELDAIELTAANRYKIKTK